MGSLRQPHCPQEFLVGGNVLILRHAPRTDYSTRSFTGDVPSAFSEAVADDEGSRQERDLHREVGGAGPGLGSLGVRFREVSERDWIGTLNP